MRVRAVAIVVLAALAFAAPAQADIWTVTNGSSDETTACNVDLHECVSLRAAIAASEATKEVADTINVPAGTININNDLVIQSDITVNGVSARTNIIDGGEKYRGFRITPSGNAKINHFTIRDGAAGQGGSNHGGGILNFSGVVQLDYVRVTASRASDGSGGGIANYQGTLTMSHSLVDGNTALNGAGVANIGGVESPDRGLFGLVDSTVFNNTASTTGTGGIDSRGGQLNVVIVSRSTVADNVGGIRGMGGLQILSGAAQAVASIVARNTVSSETANCGEVKPTNSAFNVENDKECGFSVNGVNPGLDTSLRTQGGELDVLAISAASLAVDLAPLTNCNAAGTVDQRSLSRPQGPGCDAGAYELDQAATMTITSGPSGTVDSGDVEFRFSSSEPGVDPVCQLTGPGQTGGFVACYKTNAQPYGGLANGDYTFSVRDGAFPSAPVASRSFTVAALDTTITGGPGGPTNDNTPTFTFAGTSAAAFECRVDTAAFAPCTSPFTPPALAEGDHTFEVRALSAAGAPDPTPASRSFAVDTTAPVTTITGGPSGSVSSTSAAFTFTSNESPATFQCALDGAAFGTCPASYTGLAQGSHTFSVRAIDAAANTDASPASGTWTVDTVAPDTTIATGPSGSVSSTSATFTFTSTESGSTFQCSLDGAAFATCPLSYSGLAQGSHTFQVRATDAAANTDASPASRTWTVDTVAPDTTITSGPADPTNDATPTFAFSSNEAGTFECQFDGAAFAACPTPFTAAALGQGTHVLSVRAVDAAGNPDNTPATRAFTVDLTPPPAPDVIFGPDGPTTNNSPAFGFAAADAAAVTCKLDGPGSAVGEFGECASPKSFSALAPGDYVFHVRSVDAAGNAQTTQRAFTVTVPQQATPTPTPSATPTPTPTPTPVAGRSVGARPVSGTVLVKLPGSTKFVELDPSVINNGAEFDTRDGIVEITRSDGGVAKFYDGIFKLSQSGRITTLTLTEKLTGCPTKKKRASAAATKPKTRKLWGDGKGKFRTKGQYSAATVRGTKWLVQDTCTTTLTRVTQGVVAVEDFAKRKTVVVKKGKPYTARPKKR